jgi:Putative Ig domain
MSISRALPRRENIISGTPTTAGTFTFTVRVTDDLDTFSEKALSITIT